MEKNLTKHKINASISSIENGHTAFDNVKGIKIVSKDYNILIMEDYLPVIGEVNGDVSIILEDDVKEYKNINGFYKHSKNNFILLIKGKASNA